MTLSGEKWLRTLLTALTVLIAPMSTSTLFAQGYGPDPFKPYNSQYVPYTYPTGPASPAGGGRSDVMARMGNLGANQYQGYLDDLNGQARQGSERYGIGMPYYRSAVDPNFDPQGKREYRPNQKADQSFDETRKVVTRKYIAYLTEHDPKKRRNCFETTTRLAAGSPGQCRRGATAPRGSRGGNGEQRYGSEAVRCHGSRGRGHRAQRRGRRGAEVIESGTVHRVESSRGYGLDSAAAAAHGNRFQPSNHLSAPQSGRCLEAGPPA